jgi:DNA-binding MarR family transcriptional regulator
MSTCRPRGRAKSDGNKRLTVGQARVRKKAIAGGAAGSCALPATVSHAALLDRGSDGRFRRLVSDLLTIASRMNAVREHLARGMEVSGPQYSFLIAIAHLQGERGVSVGGLARALHVSSAFVASETRKLALAGLVHKRPNPQDRRGVLLALTSEARALIGRNAAEIRAVNDLFFGELDRRSFEAMVAAASALVQGSRRAMVYLDAADEAQFLEAAE